MPKLRSSFDVSGSRTSWNKRTSWSDMENVAYNCTLTYGTCASFGSLYSFRVNLYGISYFPGTTSQILDQLRKLTTPFKHATGTKPSILHLRVLFFRCVVQKATAYADTKSLNMCYQAQKGFRGIFFEIPHHLKGCFYVPYKRKILSSYDVVFGESFSSALA